jgi:hypothetical protein
MGAVFNKNGNSNEEINNTVNKCRNIMRFPNSILCDKSLRKIIEKRMYKTVVQSAML